MSTERIRQWTLAGTIGVLVSLSIPAIGEIAAGESSEEQALLVPVSLENLTNTSLSRAHPEFHRAVRIDPGSLPTGSTEIDGVPFAFPAGEKGDAADVFPSMSGWKESQTKLKFTYLGAVSNKFPQPDYGRLRFQIPGDNYSAMHLVAFSTKRDGAVGQMTVRIGYFGRASAQMEDTVVVVPDLRADSAETSAYVVSRIPVKLTDGSLGHLFHLRVPMHKTANVTQYDTFDVELTRDVNVHMGVPSPGEFTLLPAGKRSSVIVLGVTMQRSPVEMSYTTEEYANIFSEGQRVVFNVKLTNRSDRPVTVRAFANCGGPGTGEEVAVAAKQWTVQETAILPAGQTREIPLDTTPKHRGWYNCTVGVKEGGVVLQARDTSFALLAPDARKAMGDSPFGVWCFWDGHTSTKDPGRIDKLASIINKGGWRWTYGGKPHFERKGYAPTETYQRLRKQYKISFNCQYPPYAKRGGPFRGAYYKKDLFEEKVVPWLADAKEKGYDPHYMVIHESRASLAQLRRFSENFGGAPYVFTEQERAKLEQQYEHALKFCAAMREADPDAKIVLINDYPHYVAEYLKKGFPKELFDVIGLEGAMFTRQPERQPDWLCLLGHMADINIARKQYGYEDKPVWFTEALYHATNPGNLSLHDQGGIMVREAMLALVLGIERMAMTNVLADCTDDYGWSQYGSSGLCFRDPEYNPKPSFVMYSWLTQVLDQARPVGKISCDSTVLHVLDFVKADGKHVNPVWVVKGRQQVTLKLRGSAKVYDCYGNTLDLPATDGRLVLEVGSVPLYVVGEGVEEVLNHIPTETLADQGKPLLEFDDSKQLTPLTTQSKVLEGNWDTPRIRGKFRTSFVTEDATTAMRVELTNDRNPHKMIPRYGELALTDPIVLSESASALTVRVKGNGGWGRVMFELVDAKGRIWTSCGNQFAGATNSQDCHGDSFISFDGWNTIRFPLPGQYAGKDQYVHLPRKFEWWATSTPEQAGKAKLRATMMAKAKAEGRELTRREKRETSAIGDEPVDYPVKLTRIIVTMRPHILYVDEERPVRNRVIYLDRLGVIESPEGM